MANYKFNNSGLKLFDLLSFALAIEPKNRQWFIRNLGEDIWNYYYNKTHQKFEDILYRNMSHYDYGDMKSYDMLQDLLMGNTRINQYGNTIGDTAAVEDMRNILKILNNPNDMEGQKFLFGLLKEWEKLPETERRDFDTRFANVCKMFLLEPDNSFRINDPKMKKDLLFMIGDNAKWMERFWWYDQMLKQEDLNFNAKEMQSLYDKMLESEHGFVQYQHQEELKYDKNIGAAKKYAEERLKEAKERLDQAIEEATKTKKKYEMPVTVVREKTIKELSEEIQKLTAQNALLKATVKALQEGQSQGEKSSNSDMAVRPDQGYNM